MDIVKLDEKTIVGLSARTGNSDSDMGKIIGGLWQRFFGIYSEIPNKRNDRSIGLYSGYSEEQYDITAGCEVSSISEIPEGMALKTIPSGNYAKFITRGDPVQAVSELWQEIWSLPLDRTYTGDFEEYFAGHDGEPGEIHIYIAVK